MGTPHRFGSFEVALLLALLGSACYPLGRMPGYAGSYPYTPSGPAPAYNAPQFQNGGLETYEPWNVSGQPSETSNPGRDTVQGQWKERMAQPYVFLHHTGDYRFLGDTIRQLLQVGRSLPVSGPPFALYYDDPATTATEDLVARACLPVTRSPDRLAPGLSYEVLPRSMVVYAQVPGPYNETGRSYGSLFEYMRGLGWERAGPLREIYLINPAEVAPDELLAEIQLPCRVR